ncbi:unnamed protein product [Trichogramma brassicae]|uniref:CCHC-type domain-containing protein n=1 Tax=Trichogramma brassicae TaxID=86971 RepID=A0A6H5J9P4_9HYME|nr:unnamed protein product [Trichogramma brassicae]
MATSVFTPWDIGSNDGTARGTLQLKMARADSEDLTDAQERVKWDDAQRKLNRRIPAHWTEATRAQSSVGSSCAAVFASRCRTRTAGDRVQRYKARIPKFMAHRQITSFSELEQAGKEFESVNRMNAYWHEPIVRASQHYPSAAYKPVERSQLAAVQTEQPNDKSSPRKEKEKKTQKSPVTPKKASKNSVAASERVRPRPQRSGDARQAVRSSPRLEPSGGAIKKSGKCYRCGRAGHWAAQCNAGEATCYRCHEPGHLARDCNAPQAAQAQAASPTRLSWSSVWPKRSICS